MNSAEFWDGVFEGISEKHINEAAEVLYRHCPKERQLYEIVVDRSERKMPKWKYFAGAAAAVVLLFAGFAAIKFGAREITVAESSVESYESVDILVADINKYEVYPTNDKNMLTALEELYSGVEDMREKLAEEPMVWGMTADDFSEKYKIEWKRKNGEKDITTIYVTAYGQYLFNDSILESNVEITMEDFEKLKTLIEPFTQSIPAAPPELKGGKYYLNGNPQSLVYIYVDESAKTIALEGEGVFDFLYEIEKRKDPLLDDEYASIIAEKKCEEYRESTYTLSFADITPFIVNLENGDSVYHYNPVDETFYIYDCEFRRYEDEKTEDNVKLNADRDGFSMEMQIFYDCFRGIWEGDGEKLDLGWHDNLFNHSDNRLIGFRKDKYGAYMSGGKGLWFIPSDDRETMYFYVTAAALSETPDVENYSKKYTKTAVGDINGDMELGEYGYIGIHEFCQRYGIEYNHLFDFSINDDGGRTWYRTGDMSVDWGKMYVSKRTEEESVVHLKMISGDEEKYFSCQFVKDGDKYVMTGEHRPYDVSLLTFEGFGTRLTEEHGKEVEKHYDEGLRKYISVDFYPVFDDRYYAVRTVGTNQTLQKTDREVFWIYDGVQHFLTDEIIAHQGDLHVVQEGDKLYVLGGRRHIYESTYELNVFCFEKGELKAVIPLNNKRGDVVSFTVEDGIIKCEMDIYDEEENYQVIINAADPRGFNYIQYEFMGYISFGDSVLQVPLSGYRLASETGTEADSTAFIEGGIPCKAVYEIACDSRTDFMQVDDIAFRNGEVMVLSDENGNGFDVKKNDIIFVDFDINLTPSYADKTGEGESVVLGYVIDGEAEEMMHGMDGFKINEKTTLTILAPYHGEYKFFIMNASAGLQNYNKITVKVNPKETETEKQRKELKKRIEESRENSSWINNQIIEIQQMMNENRTDEEMKDLKDDYDRLNSLHQEIESEIADYENELKKLEAFISSQNN